MRECWRFQVDWKSALTADGDPTPFAHVDHLMTFFPDGMMRMDRTVTFQRDTVIKDFFEWMASYPPTNLAKGRIGRGLSVVGEANYYPASGTTPVNDSREGDDVTWGVQITDNGWCHGSIYDRDAVLARAEVESVRTRLMRGPGIEKNYANLFYSNGEYEITVPAGTVWSATHWSFAYRPIDPDRYHDEIATRAASLEALKSIYPND